MSGARDVPFYDRDGEHWMTAEIEVDETGALPEFIQLAGLEAGREAHRRFRREHRPGSSPEWAYVEFARTWRGEPIPGSSEALRRLLESKRWATG